MRRLLLLASCLLLVPTLAYSDASIRQDSCVVSTVGGFTTTKIWFTVVNFSLPVPVCALRFTPEPFPAAPGCVMIGCDHPAGWSCSLSAGGGADYVAAGAADCVAVGTAKTGFNFTLDPDFCCYVVDFIDEAGTVLLTQEECFCGGTVSVEDALWGSIKKFYQEE